MNNAWQGFKQGRWTKEIDVRGFIQANYTPYEGDSSFLAGATENTTDRKSTRLNSSHIEESRMPSSA